jgi:integrase
MEVVEKVPRLVVPRGEKYGAQVRIRGRMVWLGTRDTRAEAEALVAAARAPKERRGGHAGKHRQHVPSEETVLEIAAGLDPLRRAFVLTALYSGLRLFEVGLLERQDVEGHEVGREGGPGLLQVRRGKGGFERVSLLYEPGLAALLEVLPAKGLVFRTSTGRPWDRKYVSRWWREAADAAGCPATFHSLRHRHACWLIDRGATDADVALQLGHHDFGDLVRREYGRHRAELEARRRLEAIR